MAKVVKQFPQSRRDKYPWDKWTDGQIWKAEPKKDFNVEPSSFRAQLHRRGTSEGKTVKATIGDDGSVFFQFTDIE